MFTQEQCTSIEYDPSAKHFFDDAPRLYRWMRNEAPVYYSQKGDSGCIAPQKSYGMAYSTCGQELVVGLAAAEIGGEMVHVSLQRATAPPAFPAGRS